MGLKTFFSIFFNSVWKAFFSSQRKNFFSFKHFFLLFFVLMSLNAFASTDVNSLTVNNVISGDLNTGFTYPISFFVQSGDSNYFDANLYYSSSQGGFENLIVDLNISDFNYDFVSLESQGWSINTMAVYDSNLFIGLENGEVRTYEDLVWSSLGDKGYAVKSMAVYDSNLFIGQDDGTVQTFDGVTWTNLGDKGGDVDAMAVYDSNLFIATNDVVPLLFTIQTFDGVTWTNLGDKGDSVESMAVYDSNLFIGQDGGTVQTFDGVTWTDLGDKEVIVESMGVYDFSLFFGGGNGNILRYGKMLLNCPNYVFDEFGSGITCSYDWTIPFGLIGSRYFDVNIFDETQTYYDTNSTNDFNINGRFDVNSLTVNSLTTGELTTLTTYPISFFVQSTDSNYFDANLYYSSSQGGFENLIVDLNISDFNYGFWSEDSVYTSNLKDIKSCMGKIYLGDDLGRVYVNDSDDNSWDFLIDIGLGVKKLECYDSNLFTGQSDGVVQTYDGSTWTNLGDKGESIYSMEVYDNNLFIGDYNGIIQTYDGSTWTNLGDQCNRADALQSYNSKLYLGDASGYVFEYDGSTWTNLGDKGAIVYSMGVNDSNLYVGFNDGIVQTFDGVNWTDLGDKGEAVNTMVSYDSNLFIGQSDGVVQTYDSVVWSSLGDNGSGVSSMDVFNSVLFLAKSDGNVQRYGKQLINCPNYSFPNFSNGVTCSYDWSVPSDLSGSYFFDVNVFDETQTYYDTNSTDVFTIGGHVNVNSLTVNELITGTIYSEHEYPVSFFVQFSGSNYFDANLYYSSSQGGFENLIIDLNISEEGYGFFNKINEMYTVYDMDVYDFNLFVGDGKYLKAYDGTVWNTVLDAGSPIYSIEPYDGNLFVSVFSNYFLGDVRTYDGSQWSNVNYSGALVESMAVYDNNLFTGEYNGVVQTYDGSTWTSLGDKGDSVRSMVVYDNNLFIGQGDGVVQTYDGSTWTSLGDKGNSIFSSAEYNNFVYFGKDYSLQKFGFKLINCDGVFGDFVNGVTCSYDWSVPSDLSGSYFFDVNVFDETQTYYDTNSTGEFNILSISSLNFVWNVATSISGVSSAELFSIIFDGNIHSCGRDGLTDNFGYYYKHDLNSNLLFENSFELEDNYDGFLDNCLEKKYQENIIVVGKGEGNDGLVFSYNKNNGDIDWNFLIDFGSSTDKFYSVVYLGKNDGNYFAGGGYSSSGLKHLTKFKYDGNVLWDKEISNSYGRIKSMVLDEDNNVVYAICEDNNNSNSSSLLKIDFNGNILNYTSYTHSSNWETPTKIILGSDNNLYFVGYGQRIKNSSSGDDWFITKVDKNGVLLWDVVVENGENANSIKEVEDGNFFVVGSGEINLLKINNEGTILKAVSFSGFVPNDIDYNQSIDEGYVYLVGDDGKVAKLNKLLDSTISLNSFYLNDKSTGFVDSFTNSVFTFEVVSDINYLDANLYYSSSQGGFENLIIDLNISETYDTNSQLKYCDGVFGDFVNGVTCSYDWSVPSDLNGLYYFDVNVFDESQKHFDLKSTDKFGVNENYLDVNLLKVNDLISGTLVRVSTNPITFLLESNLNTIDFNIFYSLTQQSFESLITNFVDYNVQAVKTNIKSVLHGSDVRDFEVYNNELYAVHRESQQLTKYDGDSWSLSSGTFTDGVLGLYDGNLWIGNSYELYTFDGNNTTLVKNFGPSLIRIHSLQSYDGNLFVGFYYGELWTFDGSVWSDLGDKGDMVQDMEVYDNNLFVGVNGENILTYNGSVWSNLNSSNTRLLTKYDNNILFFSLSNLSLYDGTNLTEITTPLINPTDAVVLGRKLYVADCSSGKVYSWYKSIWVEEENVGFCPHELSAFDNNLFVSVRDGGDDNAIYSIDYVKKINYPWSISSSFDLNDYYFDVNVFKLAGGLSDTNSTNAFTVLSALPIVSIHDFNEYTSGEEFVFDFNIQDSDNNASSLLFDLNISSQAVQGTGYSHETDVNVLTSDYLTCDSNDFSTQTTCHYIVDTTNVSDGNYYFNLLTKDETNNVFESSTQTYIDNTPPTDPTLTPMDGNYTNSITITCSGSTDVQDINYYIAYNDGEDTYELQDSNKTIYIWDITGFSANAHVIITCYAYDMSYNLSNDVESNTIVLNPNTSFDSIENVKPSTDETITTTSYVTSVDANDSEGVKACYVKPYKNLVAQTEQVGVQQGDSNTWQFQQTGISNGDTFYFVWHCEDNVDNNSANLTSAIITADIDESDNSVPSGGGGGDDTTVITTNLVQIEPSTTVLNLVPNQSKKYTVTILNLTNEDLSVTSSLSSELQPFLTLVKGYSTIPKNDFVRFEWSGLTSEDFNVVKGVVSFNIAGQQDYDLNLMITPTSPNPLLELFNMEIKDKDGRVVELPIVGVLTVGVVLLFVLLVVILFKVYDSWK